MTRSPVVGCKRSFHVAPITVEQHSQIPCPSKNILSRVIDIGHAHIAGRRGKQLHQSDRTGLGLRIRIVIALRLDHGLNQIPLHTVLL